MFNPLVGKRPALPKLVGAVVVPKVNPLDTPEVLPKFKPLGGADAIEPNVGKVEVVVVALVGKPNAGFVEPNPGGMIYKSIT